LSLIEHLSAFRVALVQYQRASNMCGIAGFLGVLVDLSERVLNQMLGSIALAILHRGPDDAGTWVDPSARVALGRARLAILDLSVAGPQPIVSASGRCVISFNGELYNHLALRAELVQPEFSVDEEGQANSEPMKSQPRATNSGYAWRGHSDTETLLAAIDLWGLVRTRQKSVGMFALALRD